MSSREQRTNELQHSHTDQVTRQYRKLIMANVPLVITTDHDTRTPFQLWRVGYSYWETRL